DLRRVPLEETGMAPKEVWCNESQERYVLAVDPQRLALFEQMCERERCPFAVVGVATDDRQLVLQDGQNPEKSGERAIDMPMDVGERTPLASLGSNSAPASGRMALAEAITNLLAAPIELPRIKLSCNWMAACGEPGEDAALYDTVKAVGMDLCPALGISVPV